MKLHTRQLGVDLSNPLDCVTEKLVYGDRLYPGEAVCFVDATAGAIEFGLDDEGHPIFWDHHNHDPEVLIWTNKVVQGEYLELQDDALVLFEHEFGRAVWGVGNCGVGRGQENPREDATDPAYQMSISDQGVVSLGQQDSLESPLWTLNLEGTVVDNCPPFVPLAERPLDVTSSIDCDDCSSDDNDFEDPLIVTTFVLVALLFLGTTGLAISKLLKTPRVDSNDDKGNEDDADMEG